MSQHSLGGSGGGPGEKEKPTLDTTVGRYPLGREAMMYVVTLSHQTGLMTLYCL